MDKLVFIKEVKEARKGESKWLTATDQDGTFWQLFGAFIQQPPEAGKAYLFTFEKNDRGYNDLKRIAPVTNLFQQKALKEVSNKTDVWRNFSVCLSYSKDLVSAGKIDISQMFEWSDKIYAYLQGKTDA